MDQEDNREIEVTDYDTNKKIKVLVKEMFYYGLWRYPRDPTICLGDQTVVAIRMKNGTIFYIKESKEEAREMIEKK